MRDNMQRKLKSVFRRSRKSRASSGGKSTSSTQHAEANSPCTDRHGRSPDRHGRTSVDSSMTGSAYTSRSRPVSSIYNDCRQSQESAKHTAEADSVSSDPNGGAKANDHKSYMSGLFPVSGNHSLGDVSLGSNRHDIIGESEARHEENVVARNIARHSTSIDGGHRDPADIAYHGSTGVTLGTPALNTTPGSPHLRKQSTSGGSIGSTLSSVSTGGSMGKYAVRNGVFTNRGLADGIHPHTGTSSHEKGSYMGSSSPSKTASTKTEWEMRKPRTSDSDNDASRSPQGSYQIDGTTYDVHNATMDSTAEGKETGLARKLRKDGVVDLRNTVDTNGDITWAPAVTHEVIKPHQHEIIQQKIYREIHNYEYFHHIQPVTMTEVLPPRHWIPNPNGEGLIEISADELPARTGENRWWSICEHPSPYALQRTSHKYRTEPEIIEAGTFMTDEGFERKETIIVHPPTFADLTGYTGPVQAVHFDHKTGERWIGELTTMDKLHELQQTLDHAPKAQVFQMGGLTESLPKAPSSCMPTRKPVNRHSPVVHSSTIG